MKMLKVAPALSLPFVFLLLFSSCFSQDCPNLIPACNGTSNVNNSTAQYSIVTNSNGPGLDQRICLSSNTTDYDVLGSTLRIVPINLHDGYYCSDIPLGPRACAMNESLRTILYFDTELIAGNDYGAVEFNFTRFTGSLRATFQIVYGPDGIQRLNEGQYTLQPSEPLILEWRIFGNGKVSFSHINSTGGISSPQPGSTSDALIPECISPQSNGSLITPPKPILATWNISAANFEDEGVFSVMISNYSSSVSVTVLQTKAPNLTTIDKTTVFGMIDNSVSIECDILNTLKVPSWYFNNVPLSGDRYTISENSLVIGNATLEDSGGYTCSASNEIGTTSLYFLLIIGSRPVITVPPFNIQVSNDSRVVLPCSVQGIPPPTVTWTVDSSYQVTDGMNGFNIISPLNALSIESVNATIDVMCRASNLFGATVSNTARITVVDIGTNYTSPNSPSIVINETESVTLSCPVVPSFNQSQWSKDNVNLNNNGSSSTYTVAGDRSGDSWGLYCCEISNPPLADSIDDCTIVNVVVNPVIDFPLSDASVQTDSTISFACYANTSNNVNLPLIRWTKDGVNINTNTPRIDVQTEWSRVSTLLIANVMLEDAGVYSCVSSNSAVTRASLTVVDGSCSNNSLSGSTAEGNTSHWTTNHPSLSDSIVTQSGGEKHFTLSPSGPVPDPSISQNLSFDRPGNYTLYFKCRMRSSGLSTLPVIVLAPPSRPSLTVPLPFPSLTSWQWVSDSINFIVESPGSLSVIMATSQTGSGSFQSVFFDDLCANLVQEVLMVSSSVSTSPSSTSTTSPPSTTPTTLQLLGVDYYYVVAGAGAGLLLLLLLFIICCSVTIYCCKKKRKSRGAEDLTKSLTDELKNNGVKLHSVSTRYTNFKGPKKDTSPIEAPKESQPVYVVPGSGNAPVYLTGNTPLLPSSFGQREEVSSYEYMETTRTHSTSSRLLLTGGGTGSTPEMVYEDPTAEPEEMYDEIVKGSPEPMMLYEDMKGEEEGGNYNYEDMNAPSAPLPPLPSHSVQNSDGVYENPQEQSELYDNPSPPVNRPKHSYSLPSVQHKVFPTRGTEKSSSFGASAGTSKGHYMSLNPSSIEDTQVYTTPSPLPSPPPIEEEGPEYVSITNQVLDLVRERTAKLDTEDDYV